MRPITPRLVRLCLSRPFTSDCEKLFAAFGGDSNCFGKRGPLLGQLCGGLCIKVVDQLAVIDRWIPVSLRKERGRSSTLRDGGVERRRLDE
ncbi:hypothetical protein GCM10009021_30230 [Halarchaeum nitratireducens]|uniref:Uncharacterized protein n=1 Tax=Halarchaeum nitratireducens TaxID=489913 RepID=A0A830GFL6_9EURY|nr:hypothetical protein GCM10009021_30230 [Halarchaeum nitratireducens]